MQNKVYGYIALFVFCCCVNGKISFALSFWLFILKEMQKLLPCINPLNEIIECMSFSYILRDNEINM